MEDMIKKLITSPYLFVFITAILGALSALWASYQQDKSDRSTQDSLNVKNDQIINLQYKVIEAAKDQLEEQRQLKVKSEKIASLYEIIANNQTEINKKAEQIKKLSEKNSTLITGGNNFCEVLVNKVIGNDNFDFLVMNNFDSPIYDLQISIENSTERHENLKVNAHANLVDVSIEEVRAIMNAKNNFNLGIIRGTSGTYLQSFPVTKNITYYDINFYARNAVWQQQLIFVKVNNDYRIASRITREKLINNSSINVVLKESVDPDIPKTLVNKLKWYSLDIM